MTQRRWLPRRLELLAIRPDNSELVRSRNPIPTGCWEPTKTRKGKYPMTTQKRRLVKLTILVLALATMLLLVSNRNWSGSSAATFQTQMPGPDAQQLFRYITKDNPYNKWKNLPDAPRFIHVRENPHSDWIAVYLNGAAYESINHPPSPFQMNYGSIIVKENYSPANGNPSAQSSLTSVP